MKELKKRYLFPQNEESSLEEAVLKMVRHYFLNPIIWKALGIASHGSFFRPKQRAWIMGSTLDWKSEHLGQSRQIPGPSGPI